MSMAREKSLYDKIGGSTAVTTAVHKMYMQIMADPLLSPFFPSDRIDMIKHHQRAFFAMAFGGPNVYSGRTLHESHAPLLEKGLTDIHFDAVVYYLVKTLKEMGVSEDLIAEARSVIEPLRNDVLGR
jgi:hemoglobin